MRQPVGDAVSRTDGSAKPKHWESPDPDDERFQLDEIPKD
jgi:hypothetical protein